MITGSNLEHDKYHLTPEGRRQVEKAAGKIKPGREFDLIFASPFLRTRETAEIIGKHLHVNVHEHEKLSEIVHGSSCEDKPHRACPLKDARKTFDAKPHHDSESWNEVRVRLMEFINDMESKYSSKTILIVSHGDPLWLLDNMGLGLEESEILENGQNGWYPSLAEFKELEWKSIPRDEYGELDLHRPFIDKISVKCARCGALMKKIPDLIDVWFDSGAMPYAQWHWPFENKKVFSEQFPANFITEAVDQTRGWFYTMLAISTLLDKGTAYKNVLCYGHVLDEKGKKMSKSKGNVVSPFEIIDKVGADAARWYFYTLNSPGEYKMFSFRDVEAKLKGFVFTLQNCVRFYELYGDELPARPAGRRTTNYELRTKNLLDKWIVSKFNGLTAEVSASLDTYDPTTAARAIEKFVVEDLSNWGLRRSRKRKEALGLLRFLLLEISKLLAPFTPFTAEDIHQRLHKGVAPKVASIHLHEWPLANKKLIDKKLESEMEEVRGLATLGLAQRKEKQIKVRQPLRSVTVKRAKKFSSDLEDLIKDELNVKEVSYDIKQEEVLGLNTTPDRELINEGYARELIRQIQDMRKEAKYKLDEKIYGQWHSDDGEVSSAIHQWTGEIKKEALLYEFIVGPRDDKKYDVEKEFDIAPSKKIWVGVRK